MPRRKRRYLPSHAPFDLSCGADWVWQYAIQRVEHGENRSLSRDGADVYRAIPLVRAMRRGSDSIEMLALRKDDPVLYAAYEFRGNGAQRDVLELESRVLARQTNAVIATVMDLARAVVDTYCSLYFHVRERLGEKAYILNRVIGVHPSVPPSPEQMVMLAAYHYGPHSVELGLDWYDHRSEAHDLREPQGRLREAMELRYEVQRLSNDGETERVLCKWLPIHRKAERKVFRHRSVREVLAANTFQMMSSLPAGFPVPTAEPEGIRTEPQHDARPPRHSVPREPLKAETC